MKKLTPQQKAAITMRERYGEDFFSKIGKHYNRPTRGNSERMREVALIKWNKIKNKEEK